jgi:putative Mg2+ transporter-C (MgtC) family protein
MSALSIIDIIIRLGGAALLCGLIGYEREFRRKPAGVRTDMLVGIGTAAMTIASIEIARLDPNGVVDISRIASTILTGIGFIGAGTIIQSKGGIVLGLTTAASIWVVAAIGLAMGLGMYALAIVATVMTLSVLVVLHSLKVPEGHNEEKNKE